MSPGIFEPLYVGGGRGEEPDGAGEADGAARLHKHRGLGVDDSSSGWRKRNERLWVIKGVIQNLRRMLSQKPRFILGSVFT